MEGERSDVICGEVACGGAMGSGRKEECAGRSGLQHRINEKTQLLARAYHWFLNLWARSVSFSFSGFALPADFEEAVGSSSLCDFHLYS